MLKLSALVHRFQVYGWISKISVIYFCKGLSNYQIITVAGFV